MAFKMTFTYGGLTITDGYVKLVNISIDNTNKTCSGDLVFLSSSDSKEQFPVSNFKRNFSDIAIGDDEDPRDVLYNYIMTQEGFTEAVKC